MVFTAVVFGLVALAMVALWISYAREEARVAKAQAVRVRLDKWTAPRIPEGWPGDLPQTPEEWDALWAGHEDRKSVV